MLIKYNDQDENALKAFVAVKKVIENPENSIVKKVEYDRWGPATYFYIYSKKGIEICKIAERSLIFTPFGTVSFPSEIREKILKLCEDKNIFHEAADKTPEQEQMVLAYLNQFHINGR